MARKRKDTYREDLLASLMKAEATYTQAAQEVKLLNGILANYDKVLAAKAARRAAPKKGEAV